MSMPLTIRGKQMLEAELKKLIHEERPAVIRQIEEARSHGDLSENAEYDAAKEKQALVEGRIQDIQGKIAGAEVVDPSTIKSETVVFGATVKIMDLESEDEVTYQIVGVDEADVKAGYISILSPLARALIGKRVGDVVVVASPKGEKEYEILSLLFK
ncbi:MAG: transcription elongation factor GreA [Bdellovibrionales bacterium]|nr:transcription elongation factor GreA [Bdellovibrionales bacterium]